MNSDLLLKFHRGQEFTKKGAAHVHCIVHGFFPEDLCYLVEYTNSGNQNKISEHLLMQLYHPSTAGERLNAAGHLCENIGKNAYTEEDGERIVKLDDRGRKDG
ncbi:hypothetical protein ACO0LO_02765 [Undibacterium sp. TJN25]|uniref:hypothetical protein n=1 Tax=Undibacterium sp. TJN25 TaxID=3413056 RepID=UPI003BF201B8